MPIITYLKDFISPMEALINVYPDQYVTEKEKKEDWWIKRNMDYFYTVAISSYTHNKKTFSRNYEIVKGILKREDLYEAEEVRTFVDQLLQQEDLPQYVKHYSILNPPINTLMGEMSKRPDNAYVKAFDDDSKSEELQFKTDFLQKFIFQKVQQRLVEKAESEGVEINAENEEDFTRMTEEQVQEYLTSYTSLAEKWGSRMLEYIKVRFGIKEKSEEGFRDLMIAAREFYHIYEDKSEEGFGTEVLNPLNVWFKTTPNEKYISDPFDLYKGAYAAGTIEVMEISEILQKFELTKEEIKHLTDMTQQNYLLHGQTSNITNPTLGHMGVKYDTYDPILLQERMMLEAELGNTPEDINSFLLPGTEISTFGHKYIVVRSYWCSKLKMGKLIFLNEEGVPETMLVDENYKNNMHPQQLSLEWGWVNQWYYGYKIGPDIYYVKPYELLEYCPIIGSIFENKNTEAKSLVDLLKPFQTLYNIFMNKLYDSLSKDWGKILLTSIRHIPTPKDGDSQDALEIWEAQAKEKGVVFVDDSPENLKAPSSFNQHTALDMSRINEMQGYYNMAAQIKQEAWELVGITKARLGSVAATQTATGTNTELSQSYAQTEPWFTHHEYTMNKYYQALLDAAQYVQSQKPTSTLSFISNEGEQSFISVNGSDLRLRDLGVFITSRSEDAQELKELRNLSQAMLQNGASPYEIVEVYTTKSRRQIKDTFKRLKKQQDAQVAQQQQIEQQQLEQQQAQFEQQQQMLLEQDEKNKQYEAWQSELDRLNKKEVALIGALKNNENATADNNGDGIADALQVAQLNQQSMDSTNKYNLELQKNNQERDKNNKQLALEYKKLKVEQEKIAAQIKIAKENTSASEIKAKRSSSKKK